MNRKINYLYTHKLYLFIYLFFNGRKLPFTHNQRPVAFAHVVHIHDTLLDVKSRIYLYT